MRIKISRFVIFQLIMIICSNTYAIELNQKAIDEFKSYLLEAKSIAVDFIQTDSHGITSEGKLLINKPYKFRCNYYPPFPLVIVGNKNYVSVYDYEMDQISRMKAQDNIFNFLLVDNVDLKKHFNFESAEDIGQFLTITIYHKLSERRSIITFNKNLRQIEVMKILEGDEVITLTFGNFSKVKTFDDELFIMKDPAIFGPVARFTKLELEKKYSLINAIIP